jgi:hypothetical protein
MFLRPGGAPLPRVLIEVPLDNVLTGSDYWEVREDLLRALLAPPISEADVD